LFCSSKIFCFLIIEALLDIARLFLFVFHKSKKFATLFTVMRDNIGMLKHSSGEVCFNLFFKKD